MPPLPPSRRVSLAGALLALCFFACSDDAPASSAAAAGAGGEGGQAGAAGGAAGAAGGAGAAGSAGAGGDLYAGFEPMSCTDRIEGLAALLGLDGIELRRASDGVWSEAAHDGQLCGGASDAGACMGEVEAARQDPELSKLVARPFPFTNRPTDRFVATRKDEVLSASDLDGLRALLGTIDSAAKMVVLLPYRVQLADPCSLRWKTSDEGFDVWALRVIMDTCPVITQDLRYTVRPTGEIVSTESGPWKGSKACGTPPPP